jgi:uncharacterized damage-inducible protein DinB
MSRAAIEQLLYLMDEAFEANREHCLLANLRSVPDDAWTWLPPAGSRSIFDIVLHVGACKFVYENHAFGDGSMRWDRPGTVPTIEPGTPPGEIIDWLRAGQRALKDSVAALSDDSELLRPRLANWGEKHETRWLVNVMIQHDLYHGGEINHIRALRQSNDRWAYDPPGTWQRERPN